MIWDTKGTDTMLETTQSARRGNASNLSPVALAQPSSIVQPNKQNLLQLLIEGVTMFLLVSFLCFVCLFTHSFFVSAW